MSAPLKPTAYAGFGETPSGTKDLSPIADRRLLIGRVGSPIAPGSQVTELIQALAMPLPGQSRPLAQLFRRAHIKGHVCATPVFERYSSGSQLSLQPRSAGGAYILLTQPSGPSAF